MRLVLQRVSKASVAVRGETIAAIGPGLLVLCGFGVDDGPDLPEKRIWTAMIEKMLDLRIFSDAKGKMNQSLRDMGFEVLLVSQFTLFADCRKGRRPSFTGAAAPEVARTLFTRFYHDVEARLPGRTGRGEFGADMDVSLVNQGPVTLVLDSGAFSDT
jgi:D-aminoacyl-tRNA deacylase